MVYRSVALAIFGLFPITELSHFNVSVHFINVKRPFARIPHILLQLVNDTGPARCNISLDRSDAIAESVRYRL